MRVCVLLLAAACVPVPAPVLHQLPTAHPTIPLIDPLEDAELLVPVMVNEDGPFVFAVDPEEPHTIISVVVIAQVVDAVGQDSANVSLTLGERTTDVEHVQFAGASLDRGGRRVDGVLGRDALGEGNVFGFDRDLGIAWLEPASSYRPLPDSVAIAVAPNSDRVTRVDASLDGAHRSLVLGLGAVHSELHKVLWASPTVSLASVVDNLGTRATTTEADAVVVVEAGDVSRNHLDFVDPQFARSSGDGVLGLDFFAPYTVELSRSAIYVRPRIEVTPYKRISRWGELPCPDLGCAQVEQLPTGEIRVTRNRQTRGHDLEVVLAGTDHRPALIAELPAKVDTVSRAIPAELAGQSLAVVDLSPFPRHCAGATGCIDVVEKN